jgi:hypothetical protein
MHDWLVLDINSSILTWTYYVFDKLEVIIMGNGYGVLGCDVFETFLLVQ